MRRWEMVTITTNEQANTMVKLFKQLQPQVGALDTETNGLHVILSKPFVVQFGWLHPTEPIGYSFAVDLLRYPKLGQRTVEVWNKLAAQLDLYLGHHIVFDLHMLTNIGLPYTVENMSDTMFYIRYAHDALTVKHGGPPLKLKQYATMYVDPKARDHESLLKKEQSALASALNNKLKVRLASCPKPPAEYKAASYTTKVLEEIFKDPIADVTSLPSIEAQAAYTDWLNMDVPLEIRHKVIGLVEAEHIPYTWLNRENLIRYAHYDIVYTLEVYESLKELIVVRDNMVGVEFENKLILPLYEMERVGFKVRKDYLEESRIRIRNYILRRRQELYAAAGQVFKIGQHALVKKILNEKGLAVTETGKEVLDRELSELKRLHPESPAIEIVTLIQELRTLEKWYSTYIIRFQQSLHGTDRLHTSIQSVGTVTGRVTSDFQQFPKKGIRTVEGEELFHPRKMVTVSGGDYDALVYLDYSQIELRFQAFYTILVGHPDLNLCRAYMPYKCINEQGEMFDYTNLNHIRSWKSAWFLEEDHEKRWSPVDVHAATTIAATGLSPDDPEFAYERSHIGKRTNFAKNYGAQLTRIRAMFPTKSEEECKKIDAAYYIAFPGVKVYHTYCYERASSCSNTQNLFGIRYYGQSGHNLINTLIQGSAAFFLKLKIRQLYEYSKANNIKSKWQMQIHDELSWEKHKDDPPEVFFKFKEIMEDWQDTLVPIVADMEVSKSVWASKEGIESLEQFKNYLST